MKTCLVVDDVTVSRFAAESFLEELGFKTIEAADGEQALEVLSSQNIDVILLDWHLKKKSGLELLQIIRQKYGTDLRVVVFSGVEDESRAAEAHEMGANAFICKPTTKEKIEHVFRSLGML